MQVLTQTILQRAASLPEGSPLVAKAFLELGSRAAIDQSLSRLAKRGQLLRVSRGIYVRPIEGRFGQRSPEPAKVIEAFAAQAGETVVPSGAVEANVLGLTTQVPVREVYLTSGHSRSLKFGKQVVELRHAPKWQLALPGRPAGRALRAMAWAGERGVHAVASYLEGKLPKSELRALVNTRYGKQPTWMARELNALAIHV